ncbi:hypothetical protein [Williamsia maris]|uniref:Transmembrane protein n=1 Tax=Williamsia maris TaxID=72806 RepID=A0ABT1HDC5_9NOCA|nr:hypothetical protein [Williamsia maris]MCP2175715.1 hypothetical protein [Williamsia maris]
MTASDKPTSRVVPPGVHAVDEPVTGDDRDGSTWTLIGRAALFVVGCALLVGCAFSVNHLSQWMQDYGTVLVFLAFFLVMSLAGRWFWVGADAAIGFVLHGTSRK